MLVMEPVIISGPEPSVAATPPDRQIAKDKPCD
jgi:hypothetical protein